MADIKTLAQRVRDVHDRYQREFANRSRITRDLSRIDAMISTLEGVLLEATGEADAQASLLPTVRSRLDLYRAEREAISKARSGGPAEVLAHRVSEWSWLNTQRYRRNYAGQNRATRDLGLLQELRNEQQRWHRAMVEAAKTMPEGWRAELITQLKNDSELYGREATAIREARASLEDSRKVGVYATLANSQFSLWREHFAQRPRAGRRLPLVDRMIRELREVLADMESVRDAGHSSESNDSNIRKVHDRIETWTSEQALIERAVAAAGPESVTGNLATDANDHFKMYRESFAGKSRSEVDATLLGNICERLHEIGRIMDTLDRTWAIARNAQNLEVVLENLKMYEREYSQVRGAQQPKS
jgi:hypothetical protein